MPTISLRGPRSLDTQTSILHLWMMLPTVHHPSFHPSRSFSLDIPNMKLSLSVATCWGSRGGQFLTDTWSFTTGKENVLSHNTSKEKWQESDSSHGCVVEKCLQDKANCKVTQRCQHGIPYVVLIIFKAFLRRECGRGNGIIHCALGNDEPSKLGQLLRNHWEIRHRNPAHTYHWALKSNNPTIPCRPKWLPTGFFCFEGLIPEFGNNYLTVFFHWGPIFEFGNNYRPVFSPGAPFSSQVKNAWNRFYSPGCRFWVR